MWSIKLCGNQNDPLRSIRAMVAPSCVPVAPGFVRCPPTSQQLRRRGSHDLKRWTSREKCTFLWDFWEPNKIWDESAIWKHLYIILALNFRDFEYTKRWISRSFSRLDNGTFHQTACSCSADPTCSNRPTTTNSFLAVHQISIASAKQHEHFSMFAQSFMV